MGEANRKFMLTRNEMKDKITLVGTPLTFEPFRKLDLAGWAVPICAISGPGQLHSERVIIESMMLLDSGAIVLVTKPCLDAEMVRRILTVTDRDRARRRSRADRIVE